MKYRVRVGDRSFDVVVQEAAGRTTVVVDGREMELELEEAAPGVYALLADGKPYDLAAARRSGGYSLVVGGVPFDFTVEDERQQRLASVRAVKPVAEGRIAVRAPMPGLVSAVEVVEGDQVEKGARLVVLEAMKMENDIAASRAGRVAEVKVSKGNKVEQGQVLVVLE